MDKLLLVLLMTI